MRGQQLFSLLLLSLPGCSDTLHQWPIDGPFYIGYIEDPRETRVMRCFPDGGCAGDELPDPVVYAAGADARYVVAARHPNGDRSKTEYYYVLRTPPDEKGYGLHKTLFGPFDAQTFEVEKRRLNLPEFTTILDEYR